MTKHISEEQLSESMRALSARTIGHYEANAERFWLGTRDHDVNQNIDALVRALPGEGPHRVLDFGCGPGRDLVSLSLLGVEAVGLDGCAQFCAMAREHSGCTVLHQDFLDLRLADADFDGIFANASLFHVPNERLPEVLGRLNAALRPSGVLFSSNPRGQDQEGWNGARFGSYHSLEAWTAYLVDAGFTHVEHYYRPPGLPRDQQPWLASVWRKAV